MDLKKYKIAYLPIIITGGIFLINLVLKVFIVYGKSLYGDEPFTLYFAQQPFSNIIDRLVNDSNPFFHPFILHVWVKLFGVTAFSGKLLSAIFSSLTAALLFKLFFKRFGIVMPIIASALFTISEINLFYAQEIRAFALVGLFTTISVYLFFEVLFNPKKHHIVTLGIVNLLLVMTHYAAFLLPVTEGFAILFFMRSHKKGVLYFIYSQVLALLLFAPWFVYAVVNNIPEAGKSWIPVPAWINLRYLIVKLTTQKLLIVYAILFVISGVFIFLQRHTKFIPHRIYLVLFLFFWMPVLLNFAISQNTPIMISRYLLFTTIPFYLSIGYYIDQIRIKKYFPIILGILVIMIASYKIKLPKTPDNWIGKLDQIKKERIENSIVFINAWWQFRPFAYYYDYPAFIDYNMTLEKLSKQNIHAVFSIEQMDKIIGVKRYDEVYLVKNQGVPSKDVVAHFNKKGYEIEWEKKTITPLVFKLKLKK